MNRRRAALVGERPFVLIKSAEKVSKRPDVTALMQEPGACAIVHVNFVDDRLHDAHTGPYVLYQEWELEWRELVLPYLAHLHR